jgi:pimeloyl-ACP methyl ester carboxylesterase
MTSHLEWLQTQIDATSDVDERTMWRERWSVLAGMAGDTRRTFLMFEPDTQRDGNATDRIVEVFGELGDAEHVAIFTPGIHTDIWSGYEWVGPDRVENRGFTADAMRLCKTARSLDGQARVATVAFLDYDSPDEGSNQDALNPSYGFDGAARLSVLVNTHTRDDQHVTLVGHSYGSFVSGTALWNEATNGVDDLVVAGSPGTGVALSEALVGYGGPATECRYQKNVVPPSPMSADWDASQRLSASGHDVECLRRVEPAHVWALQAPDDQLADSWYLASLWPNGMNAYGRAPHFDDFGAHEMHTNCPDSADGCGGFDQDISGHSDYWKSDSMSLKNTALVILGRYSETLNERASDFGIPSSVTADHHLVSSDCKSGATSISFAEPVKFATLRLDLAFSRDAILEVIAKGPSGEQRFKYLKMLGNYYDGFPQRDFDILAGTGVSSVSEVTLRFSFGPRGPISRCLLSVAHTGHVADQASIDCMATREGRVTLAGPTDSPTLRVDIELFHDMIYYVNFYNAAGDVVDHRYGGLGDYHGGLPWQTRSFSTTAPGVTQIGFRLSVRGSDSIRHCFLKSEAENST